MQGITKPVVIRALTGTTTIGESYELRFGLPSIQEVGGQVVFEAEEFTYQIGRSNRIWLTQTILADYSGIGYVSALPDTDLQFTTNYTAASPNLQYSINFTTTGTYYVWLRGYASNAAGDSIYVGLDNQPARILSKFIPREWTWASDSTQGDRVTVNVTTPGVHKLSLWQREDGLRLDRILLTTDGTYTPSGSGP